MTTLARKARADLKRRPARSILTVATLALGIAGVGTIAVPGLVDRTMQREVRAARLHDVSVTIRNTALTPPQLDELAHLPNVTAVDARVVYSTQASIGDRRSQATIWGVGLASQQIDVLRLTSGERPTGRQVLADDGDSSAASFPVDVGDQIQLRSHDGRQLALAVAGTGRGLATSPSAFTPSNNPVFYATPDTVRELSGIDGVNSLALRLADNTPDAQTGTVAAIRDGLHTWTGNEPFVDLPETRSEGDWPGRSTIDQITSLLGVVTLLAVVCALFLIANTMNTLVSEQTSEIAVLKALGGRRRQIARVLLHTAALLGAAGAVLGASLGVAIAYLLARFFASTIFDVHAGFAASIPVVAVSLVAGPVLAMAASLPALRRALRRSVAETLADRGASSYGQGRLDRLVAHSQILSSPTRMGIRNVLRQKRRSTATVAQVAVAVALALALFSLGRSVTATLNGIYATQRYDIELTANSGAPQFDNRAQSIAAATAGVNGVQPVLESSVGYDGSTYAAFGMVDDPLYRYQLRAGRWFTAADDTATPAPVVLGPTPADKLNARVGQSVVLDTAAGPARFEVVGIDTGQNNNGGNVYLPLPVLQQLTGRDGTTNALWVTTSRKTHSAIDQATLAVQDHLASAGYPADAQKRYVQQSDNRAQNDTLLTVIQVMGVLVVGIALIGLLSTLTMGVIERTREIGVLRALGAGKRQIRRVFRAEGVTLATIGWIVGLPSGWLLFRGLLVLVRHVFSVNITAVFPATAPPVILIATIALTVLVARPALRRAVRTQAGTALRYE